MPELSAQQVIDAAKALQQQSGFSAWRTVTQARQDLRFRQTAVDVPGIDYKWEERSPALEVNIQRFNNKIDAAAINVEVIARSSKPSATRAAQNVQNFYYQLFYDWTRPLAGRTDNPNRRAIDQQTAYGIGIRHLDFAGDFSELVYGKGDIAEKLGSERFHKNPFILECPSVMATFWEPDGSMFGEVGERTISSLVDVLGDDAPDELKYWYTSDTMWENEQSWEKKVKVYRLETEDEIYVVCEHEQAKEGIRIERRENVAGRPWYVLAYGNLTSHPDPQFAYQPLVAPVYPLTQRLNVLGTMLNSGALQAGKPVHQVVADGSRGPQNFMDWLQQPEKTRTTIRVGDMDAVWRNEPGFHLELLPVPDFQYVYNMYQETKQEIRDWGFPPPLSPDLNVSAKSGYDRSKMQEPASEQLEPALRAYASSWRELFIRTSEIIMGLGVPITIPVRQLAQGYGHRESVTIRPEDFQDQDISVTFDATPASAKYPDRESNIRMVGQGFMSRETFMKAEYDDNVAEQERIDQERLGAQMDALADQDAMTVIMALRPQAMMDAAAQAGLPLATPPPEMGGPAPGEEMRMERPPEGAAPGVGAPLTPPVQAQNGVNPDLGAGVVGAAP